MLGHSGSTICFQWISTVISVNHLSPLTLLIAVKLTYQFVFVSQLGFLGFLIFNMAEVTDIHNCPFKFFISASEYIFFLLYVYLKDIIQCMVTLNSKAFAFKEVIQSSVQATHLNQPLLDVFVLKQWSNLVNVFCHPKRWPLVQTAEGHEFTFK